MPAAAAPRGRGLVYLWGTSNNIYTFDSRIDDAVDASPRFASGISSRRDDRCTEPRNVALAQTREHLAQTPLGLVLHTARPAA